MDCRGRQKNGNSHYPLTEPLTFLNLNCVTGHRCLTGMENYAKQGGAVVKSIAYFLEKVLSSV